VTDTYGSTLGSDGFYLQTSANVTIDTPTFIASPFAYNLTTNQKQLATQTGTSLFSYYYDNTTGNPVMEDLSFSIVTTPVPISGIWVIYGTPTIDIVADISNLGTYFYKSPIATFTNVIGTLSPVTTVHSTATLSAVTNVQSGSGSASFSYLPSSVHIVDSFASGTLALTYGTTIALSGVGQNVNGTSTALSAPTIQAIIDGPSYTLVYQTLPQSILRINTGTSIGFRVWTGLSQYYDNANPTPFLAIPPILAGVSTTYLQVPYDYNFNQLSINDPTLSETYSANEELQVSYGAFQTKSSSLTNSTGYVNYNGTYQNTFDYSTISGTGYRFATFAWKANAPSSGSYGTLTFKIIGTNVTPVTSGGLLYSTTGQKLLLYYRIEDSTNIALSTDGSTLTSQWIDGNNNVPYNVNSSNYYSAIFPYYGLLSVSTSGSTTTINVITPKPFNINNYSNITIYCRIGISMSSPFSFQYMTATLST
jgi:hypothetical protein